jgi:hypothetical protein
MKALRIGWRRSAPARCGPAYREDGERRHDLFLYAAFAAKGISYGVPTYPNRQVYPPNVVARIGAFLIGVVVLLYAFGYLRN